jgi:predicted lactoylglutathione lyase
MKISKLRQIVREEYLNVLTEAFADPEIRKLAKMRGMDHGRWRNFFRAFANTHDIAWDKLPAGTLNKSTNLNDPLIKDGLAFWIIENEKPNPYRNDRFWNSSSRLWPGVLAVTLNGKIQYMSGKGTYSGGTSAADAVGQAGRGMLQVKKLKEMADHVLVMNFESFRGGTTAMKAKRAELKLGKDTFKDARAWKQANMKRYKDILNARVSSRDQVDAMVAKIVKIANEAVQTGMEVIKMNNYDRIVTDVNGTEVEIEYVTGAMGRALGKYAEYIRYSNQAEKDKDSEWASDYNAKAAKEVAGYIKKILNAFESKPREISRY